MTKFDWTKNNNNNNNLIIINNNNVYSYDKNTDQTLQS